MAEAQQVIKKGSRRVWVQYEGPQPNNAPQYHGIDGAYFQFTGGKRTIQGVGPIWESDPNATGQWVQVGSKLSPGDMPAGVLEVTEVVGQVPFALSDLYCSANIYILNGDECKTPSNFDYGWSSYLEIWPQGIATDADLKDRTQRDGDDPVMDSISYKFASYGPVGVGGVQLTEQAAATITTAVGGAVYADRRQCAGCGASNDGTKWFYSVVTGPAAAKPALVYTVDGGATWTSLDIDAGVNAEVMTDVKLMGNYIVAFSGSTTAAGHYVIAFNTDTGVPIGTAWTKVTSGYTATRPINDVVVISEREAYGCANAGVIHKITNPLGAITTVLATTDLTSANLTRMRGQGRTLVAVGATGVVAYSFNKGQSWSLATQPNGATAVGAVFVRSAKMWWVASGTSLYYTFNGGTTWTAVTLPGVTVASIQDINFATPEVGLVTAVRSGASVFFSTQNAGVSWAPAGNGSPRILAQPVVTQSNRIIFPTAAHATKAVNNFAIVGANGSDGSLLLARGSVAGA